MSPSAVLPILAALKWPVTLTGAILVFGLSTNGTLSLVADNVDKLVKPATASPHFNIPPVRQIGDLDPIVVVPTTPQKNDGGTGMPEGFAQSTTTVARTLPEAESASLLPFSNEPVSFGSGRIGPSAVNIRAAASKASASLGVLAAGTPIKTGETSGGWVHVEHEGGEGWVYSTYIEGGGSNSTARSGSNRGVLEITISGGAETPAEPEKPANGKLVEAGSRIVVREAPESGSAALFRLDMGERVRIVERKGRWARIATTSGEGGWIRVK